MTSLLEAEVKKKKISLLIHLYVTYLSMAFAFKTSSMDLKNFTITYQVHLPIIQFLFLDVLISPYSKFLLLYFHAYVLYFLNRNYLYSFCVFQTILHHF